MTTWALSFTNTFFSELLNLPQAVQKKISKTLKVLETDPISAQGDAKKLKGYTNNVYRVRLGDYIRDGIYVSRYDGLLQVKRLQRQPKGVVRVSSDNPAYDPFSVNLHDEGTDFIIVGRVVWVGRKLGSWND